MKKIFSDLVQKIPILGGKFFDIGQLFFFDTKKSNDISITTWSPYLLLWFDTKKEVTILDALHSIDPA